MTKILLIIICLLSLFLRIYDLAGESIWRDEIISIQMVSGSVSQIIESLKIDVHPPLYFILLHYWTLLFGDSEFSTRFLSAIFGALTVPLIYKMGTLLFNKETGMIGSLLLAVSVFHINYSQEVRNYSLMALTALASMYFFIKLCEKDASRSAIAKYIISSLLLI